MGKDHERLAIHPFPIGSRAASAPRAGVGCWFLSIQAGVDMVLMPVFEPAWIAWSPESRSACVLHRVRLGSA